MMRVLIACEYSGAVRDAFIAKGHQAISADILPTEKPGPHHLGDVRELLSEKWDLIIAHPPCTYLCNSGVRWLHTEPGRWEKLEAAAKFFRLFLKSPTPRICIENPIMHKYAIELLGGRKQTQTIQPYEYGHPESKRTALWLKGLPPLRPTEILSRPARGFWNNQTPSGRNGLPPSKDRAKLRSKTYEGIAAAMADQWGSSGAIAQLEIING
tara:strand:- start:59 stop:694 length:636 start_codon:yes stop_codon:yes gene_type:complete